MLGELKKGYSLMIKIMEGFFTENQLYLTNSRIFT